MLSDELNELMSTAKDNEILEKISEVYETYKVIITENLKKIALQGQNRYCVIFVHEPQKVLAVKTQKDNEKLSDTMVINLSGENYTNEVISEIVDRLRSYFWNEGIRAVSIRTEEPEKLILCW